MTVLASACRADTPTELPPAQPPQDAEAPQVQPEPEPTPEPVAEPTPAPEPVAEPEAEPAPGPTSRANLRVGSVSADGQRIVELACQLDRAPLLASMTMVGALAKRKKAFDRCASGGDAVAVTWTAAGGKTSDVQARGAANPKVDACVAKALGKAVFPLDAKCTAIVLVGDKAGADERLEDARKALADLPGPH